MKRNQAFSIYELITIISIIAIALSIMLSVFMHNRMASRRTVNNSQIRGIQGSFILFCSGNNQWYPGLRNDGQSVIEPFDKLRYPEDQDPNNLRGETASTRLALLLNSRFFDGNYIISPAEKKSRWTTGQLTTAQFSYALLQIDSGKGEMSLGRRGEWCANTFNEMAPVISDRSFDLDPEMQITSLWSNNTNSAITHPDEWQGSVAWNDNHVTYEKSAVMKVTKFHIDHQLRYPYTRTRETIINPNDNLFTPTDGSATTANASMVYN